MNHSIIDKENAILQDKYSFNCDQNFLEKNNSKFESYLDPENNELTNLVKVCSICYQNIQIGEKLIRIPGCEHVFHSNCILKWVKIKVTCPYCRTNIRKALLLDTWGNIKKDTKKVSKNTELKNN